MSNIINIGGGAGGSGSNVVPNPQGTATDTLTKIGIDGTIYGFAGSGGSGHNYSTAEQVVGTWIDGRPLYEKTLNVGTIGTSTIFAHGISNLDEIIDYKGFGVYAGSNAVMPYQNPQVGSGFGINTYDSTNIEFMRSTNLGSNFTDCYVTIRYTKTGT